MSHLTRREFAALLAAVPFTRNYPTAAAAPVIVPPGQTFLAGLPSLMDLSGVPGLSIAVIHDDRVVWSHYAGLMDVDRKRAVNAATLFPAASLSKPVFAYAALRLVDQEKLDLDRPLKLYLPDHAPADARGDRITARHVLSHSSGLRNWRNRTDQPLTPDFDPGARFQYSGEGFYYLQRVVEVIVGKGFEQHMQDSLLQPLGMTNSTYAWRNDVEDRLTLGYTRGQAAPTPSREFANRLLKKATESGKPLAQWTHSDIVAAMQTMTPAPPALPNFIIPNAAASMVTTVSDYGNFLAQVLTQKLGTIALKPDTRALMMKPHPRINSALSWGLGWGLQRENNLDYLWHWGDNGAWKNFVLVHPDSRSALVTFTNGANGLRLAERIVSASTGHQHATFLWL